jgi:hypothetical protein
MDHAVAAGPTRVRAVRTWWRAVSPPPSLAHRLDIAYTTLIVTAIFGAMAYGTASSALAQVVTPHWLATYGASLALVLLVVTAHWGAYQGPVVFTVGDVAWLLGGPLSRRALTVRRLASAHALGAVAGALVAAVLLVGLGGQGRGVDAAQIVGVTAALAELGILGVAAAWAVQRSARVERAFRLATWPIALLAAALAFAGADAAVSSPAALAVLTPLTIAAVVVALRGCGDCPAERHMRRAEARATAVASLAGLDPRTARRGLSGAATPRDTWGIGADLPLLRRLARERDALIVVWRDVVAMLRTPARALEAAALVAGGMALAVLVADKPAAVAAGVVVAYFGAAMLLGPLRAELDVPGRMTVLLIPRPGDVVFAHALLPAAVATTAAALAAAGCATGSAEPAAALVAVVLGPGITGCAAMSARRGGRMPVSVLANATAGDPSGGAVGVLSWLARWPAAALALAGVPIALVGHSTASLVPALIWAVAGSGIIAALLRGDPET